MYTASFLLLPFPPVEKTLNQDKDVSAAGSLALLGNLLVVIVMSRQTKGRRIAFLFSSIVLDGRCELTMS